MDIAIKMGDLAAAELHAERVLNVADATSNRALVSWAKINGASLAVRRGDIHAARSTLADGLSIALALGAPALKFDAVRSFAEILQAQGETSCARRVLAFAAEHPVANGQIRDQIGRQLSELPESATAASPLATLEFDEVLHRIVVESSMAHAPLIATLRGMH
jgi:ATP/maltotriose-dependent transcriptional regulator MalT